MATKSKALRILLFTNALVLLAGAMLAPIYALYVEQIGGDLLDASITATIFALAAGITTLIAGKYTDKINQKRYVVVFGYLLIGASFVLLIFIDSIIELFIIQAIIGFAEAIYSPAFDALYSENLVKHKEARDWGKWESMKYFTTAIGAGLGGLIVNQFGFGGIFLVMALLCGASAIYIALLKKTSL